MTKPQRTNLQKQDPSDMSKRKRIAITGIIGAAVGVILGMWFVLTTESSLTAGLAIATGVGGLTALLTGRLMQASKDRVLSPQQKRLRVAQNFVADWKLEAVRTLVKTNRNKTEENETEIKVVTNWHPLKLVTSTFFPVAVTGMLIWGATDFTGYERVLKQFTTDYKPWMLLLAMAGAAFWWYRKNGSRIFRPTAPAIIVTMIGFWGFLRFPGASVLGDAFATGAPAPWLWAAVLGWLWICWRTMKWFYGFIMVTDKRLVIGTIMPFLLPNSIRNMALNKVATCEGFETALGNLLGYGRLEIDGVGDRDRFFGRLTPVPHYEEVADAVNT